MGFHHLYSAAPQVKIIEISESYHGTYCSTGHSTDSSTCRNENNNKTTMPANYTVLITTVFVITLYPE